MTTINGTDYSDDLVWENRYEYPAAAQSVRTTLGGRAHIQTASLSEKGREIKLTARRGGSDFTGYFTHAQVNALKILERDQTQVEFVYEGITLNVILKVNGVSVAPLIERPNMENTDWYTGTITFIEV